MVIERAAGIGFCYGVKRAITMLEAAAREHGEVETLGAVVHNRPVLERLAKLGVRVVGSGSDVRASTVAISSHGVSPQVEAALRLQAACVVDTTCPFVHRAQVAAHRLAESGFFTVIYGDVNHPEVQGVLGWTHGNGMATLCAADLGRLASLPRRLGILSQTTQIPASFNQFVKDLLDIALVRDAEIRIIDTICHDIRERQENALALAHRVSVMLVIGGHSSANSAHLVELCASVTPTYLVETADEIQPSWLEGQQRIGIASGASTDAQTIDEVEQRLRDLTGDSQPR